MDFTLNKEQLAVKEKAAAFAEKYVRPVAADNDAKGEFPHELVKKLGEEGLLGLSVDKKYGGGGVDMVSAVTLVKEIAKVDAATAIIIASNAGLVSTPIMLFGTEEQKQKYIPDLAAGKKIGAFALTEKGAGTDSSAQQTTIEDKGDYYLLNGEKKFITNGGVAETYIVFGMTDKSKGYGGITALIVEGSYEGVSAGKLEKKMGIRASQTAEMHFDNVKVPKENLLGKEGQGFEIAMATLDIGRMGVGAQALGIAEGAYEATVKYMQEREQFGIKIAQLDTLRFEMAALKVKLESARMLVYRAASYKDMGLPYSEAAAMGKLAASEAAVDITRKAVQFHGGYGYMQDYPIERMYRDAKITEIYEGTSEVQKMVIAANTFNLRSSGSRK
ncbi:MAG: acyl-CoA dehydrogenase family protein [Clostridia bacterium]|nr:acyl-CoA dehydrogenase family protein [Clostridia bacterium]